MKEIYEVIVVPVGVDLKNLDFAPIYRFDEFVPCTEFVRLTIENGYECCVKFIKPMVEKADCREICSND